MNNLNMKLKAYSKTNYNTPFEAINDDAMYECISVHGIDPNITSNDLNDDLYITVTDVDALAMMAINATEVFGHNNKDGISIVLTLNDIPKFERTLNSNWCDIDYISHLNKLADKQAYHTLEVTEFTVDVFEITSNRFKLIFKIGETETVQMYHIGDNNSIVIDNYEFVFTLKLHDDGVQIDMFNDKQLKGGETEINYDFDWFEVYPILDENIVLRDAIKYELSIIEKYEGEAYASPTSDFAINGEGDDIWHAIQAIHKLIK